MDKKPRKISLIGSRATSVLSVAMVLVIIGICLTLGITVHRASSSISAGTTIMVTMYPGEDAAVVNAMKREFNVAPWLSDPRYEFTDRTTVLAREKDNMDEVTSEALSLLSENPYGDEFVLYLAEGWRNSDSIKVLSERLRAMPGVDIVSGDASVMGQANDSLHRVLFYLALVGVVLLLISVALIKNTISLSIYSRRFNIHTMKMVGATNSFIRRPFVRAGMYTGLVAGFVAVMVVCSIQCYLMFTDDIVGEWIDTETIIITAVVLVVLGALIARAAAWWSATTYLYRSYDSLFRK